MKKIILLMSLLCLCFVLNAQRQSYKAVLLEEYYKGEFDLKLELSYDESGRIKNAQYSNARGDNSISVQFSYSSDRIEIQEFHSSAYGGNQTLFGTIYLSEGKITNWDSKSCHHTANYVDEELIKIDEERNKEPMEYLYTWENDNITKSIEREKTDNGFQVTKIYTMSEYINPSSNPIPIEFTEMSIDGFHTPCNHPYGYLRKFFGKRTHNLIQSYTAQQKEGNKTWDPSLWEFSYDFDSNGNITDFYAKKDGKDREHIHVTYAQISTGIEIGYSSNNTQPAETYNLKGQRVTSKVKGVNIVRNADGKFHKIFTK